VQRREQALEVDNALVCALWRTDTTSNFILGAGGAVIYGASIL
jgi:hypothetical protein